MIKTLNKSGIEWNFLNRIKNISVQRKLTANATLNDEIEKADPLASRDKTRIPVFNHFLASTVRKKRKMYRV